MATTVLKGAIYACFLQLALKAAAQAASPEPAFVSTRCFPEKSATSACLWTGDCPRGGCEDRCIVNEGTTNAYFTLLDRAAGEEFYSACPLLAYWMNKIVEINNSPARRRLQSGTDAGGHFRETAASTTEDPWRPASDEDRALLHAVSGARHQAGTHLKRKAPSRSTQRRAAAADLARRRRLLDTGPSEAPAPEGSTFQLGVSSDVPSNLCVDESGFVEGGGLMSSLATRWREVFASDAAGEPLSADLDGFEYVLLYPNEYQFMIRMLEDPERAAEYMATRCADREMRGEESLHYIHWLEPDVRETLDDELTMVQCADNFGAFVDFDRNYRALRLQCTPPFGVTPDCYTPVAEYIISSSECALAYATTFNVTDTAPLARIAAITEAIQVACDAVETEAECLSARTPALQDLQDIQEGLPVPNALEFEAPPPIGPVDPVPVVCFTPECEAEAAAPEAPAPELGAPADAPELLEAAPPPAVGPTSPAPPQGAQQPDAGALDDNGMLTRADVSAGRAPAPAATAVAAAAVAIVGAGLGLLQPA